MTLTRFVSPSFFVPIPDVQVLTPSAEDQRYQRAFRHYGWPDSSRKDDFQLDLDDMQSRWQMEGADKLQAFSVEQNMAREAGANAAAAQRNK